MRFLSIDPVRFLRPRSTFAAPTPTARVAIFAAGALFAFASATPAGASDDDNWWSGFSAPPSGQGMNRPVLDMVEWNGLLVAGGSFSDAGTSSFTFFLAKWSGSSWSAFAGFSPDGWVRTLETYGTDLVVGGDFTSIGVPAKGLARYDGATWSAFGTSVASGQFFASTTYGGDLVVGGDFSSIDGVAAANVARWDGSTWHAMGPGLGGAGGTLGTVRTLAVHAGELYAGGPFTTSGGTPTFCVAKWIPGSGTWAQVLDPPYPFPHTLKSYGGDLIAGGSISLTFTTNAPLNGIARFNGTTWVQLDGGVTRAGSPAYVNALLEFEDDLVATGTFDAAGGAPAAAIARWNGTNWATFGSGLTGTFSGMGTTPTGNSLGTFDGHLFVGGNFTSAGGKSSRGIGRWTEPSTTDISEVANAGTRLPALFAAPNPFSGSTMLHASLATPGLAAMSLIDVTGRVVRTWNAGNRAVGTFAVAWNGLTEGGEPAAPGVYFLRLETTDPGTRRTQEAVSARVVLTD